MNRFKWIRGLGRFVATTLIIICGWEGVRLISQTTLLPSVSDVAAALPKYIFTRTFAKDVSNSFVRWLVGYGAGAAVGIGFGLLTGSWKAVDNTLGAFLRLIRPLPAIAMAPLIGIVLGYSEVSRFLIVGISVLHPVLIATYEGVRGTPKEWLWINRLAMGHRPLDELWIRLMAATPQVVSGMRTGIGSAFTALVAAEMSGTSSGILYRVYVETVTFRLQNGVAGLVVLGVLCFILDILFQRSVEYGFPWIYRSSHEAKRWPGLTEASNSIHQSADRVSCQPPRPDIEPHPSDAPSEPLVVVADSISVGYRTRSPAILENLSFQIKRGEAVAITGPSGVGKSTLLAAIAGIIPVSSGSISHPELLPDGTGGCAMLFQEPWLFPWLTVLKNVEWVLRKRMPDREKRREAASKALCEVGLAQDQGKYPSQLSRGMSQRVAFCRCSVAKPKLILADEPFASLDMFAKEECIRIFLRLCEENECASIVVTHDIHEAVMIADHVHVLAGSPPKMIGHLATQQARICQNAYHKLTREIHELASCR